MLSRRTLLSTTVVAALALSQSDCTIIGAGIGELIDATTARSLTPEGFAPEMVEPGHKITLQLRNGHSIKGEYIGIEQLPAEEYAARYASTREQQPTTVPLPELGDTVTLCMTRGGELHAEFLGFDFYRVSVRTLGRSEPESVEPQGVRELHARGSGTITGEVLEFLASEGVLPFRSAVAVQTTRTSNRAGGKRLVPLDQVALIEWDSDTGRTVGTVIGGVVDAALIVFVTAALAASGGFTGFGY